MDLRVGLSGWAGASVLVTSGLEEPAADASAAAASESAVLEGPSPAGSVGTDGQGLLGGVASRRCRHRQDQPQPWARKVVATGLTLRIRIPLLLIRISGPQQAVGPGPVLVCRASQGHNGHPCLGLSLLGSPFRPKG